MTIVSTRMKANGVPGSDCAGEVMAVGAQVNNFKRGDRVSVNFNTKHMYGDFNKESVNSTLGGDIDGVLTEYRSFSVEV